MNPEIQGIHFPDSDFAMQNWVEFFRNSEIGDMADVNIAGAVAHCWPIESVGWSFRCVKGDARMMKVGVGASWHTHNEYQLQISAGGVFRYRGAKSREFVIRAGQLVLIPWKYAHEWICLEEGTLVGFSLELLPTVESIRRSGLLFERMQYLAKPSLKPLIDDFLKACVGVQAHSLRSKITASRLYLLTSEILAGFLPSTQSLVDSPDERGCEVVSRVVRYANENFSRGITLEQIAREMQMSVRQLYRLFMKHAGRSLHDYLLEMRLEMAFKQLTNRSNKLQIKEIAFACGFSSQAYFSRCFRQAYGLSPSSVHGGEISRESGFTVQSATAPED